MRLCDDCNFLKLQEDEDIDALVNQTTSPRIIGVAGDPYPDPVYIAVEGSVLGGPLKVVNSIFELPLALIAVYYVFNIRYPLYSNVYPFLEAILFNNKDIIRNKVVVHKVISVLA